MIDYTIPLLIWFAIIGAFFYEIGRNDEREHAKQQKYEAENTKLRELVRDMFGGYKGAVEMLPSCYSKDVAEMAVRDIADRMREIGIEANE